MTDFSLALALVDLIPVTAFGAAVLLLAEVFPRPLFIIGAALSFLAGLCKVTWKLILGTVGRDVKWLNRIFLPSQGIGWLLILFSVLLNLKRIRLAAVIFSVSAMPQFVFFLLWAAGMGAMIWYKKKRFKRYDAKSNWTAEIINSATQLCFLSAMLFAVK